jgi:putative flippase GtrA
MHKESPRFRGRHYALFLSGSVLCASINNIILIIGDYLGAHYVPLTFLYYLVSSSVGYVWHCRITYRDVMTIAGYWQFVLGISLGLPLSLMILALLTDWLGSPMWFASPVMTALMLVFNYKVARFAILRPAGPR